MDVTASGPIRAKYFVKSKLVHHNHGPLYELGPIVANGDSGSEDEGYFESSPQGECSIRYDHDKDPGFEVGSYYYFDFTPIGEEPEGNDFWTLDRRTEMRHDIEFSLCPSRRRGTPFSWGTEFKVTVDPDFTQADFGKPGGMFLLKIEKAPQ